MYVCVCVSSRAQLTFAWLSTADISILSDESGFAHASHHLTHISKEPGNNTILLGLTGHNKYKTDKAKLKEKTADYLQMDSHL